VRRNAQDLVDGFFAAGEAACVSVHGANRLGSNSLLECVVYGRRVGTAIAQAVQGRSLPTINEQQYLQEARQELQTLLDQPGELRIGALRQEFQDCMTDYCGVFRSEALISKGLQEIQTLKQKYQSIRLDDQGTVWNTEILEALELRSLMLVGEVIMTSALHRQESRGAHCREDFADRNDADFLKHTLATYTPQSVQLDYMPVVLNRFEPQERKY
jgi:succinate dehydrogenase / fumarate reductase, flavoprotein subunit